MTSKWVTTPRPILINKQLWTLQLVFPSLLLPQHGIKPRAKIKLKPHSRGNYLHPRTPTTTATANGRLICMITRHLKKMPSKLSWKGRRLMIWHESIIRRRGEVRRLQTMKDFNWCARHAILREAFFFGGRIRKLIWRAQKLCSAVMQKWRPLFLPVVLGFNTKSIFQNVWLIFIAIKLNTVKC